ncbi:AAA family ATPase [Jeotgalibacillus marinus]|uniref:Nuclease SbcCD subunit C n=1 Tax=Jeotgalibacillus marinus TaxID=86667 RepID=A0ABV3Q4V3_9BACL
MKRYRINKLDIKGFRIYSRKQSINFFENLTVVYGRNGRGKTTLQDAVGWLFNNNIARYISYKGEWNRAKNTHIRSLINPDIETQITGYFKEVSSPGSEIQKITRNETEIYDPGGLIDSFFDSSGQRDDLLWAHSLSQAKLQELAVANGRDRLENLAPLLDLTEVNNKVKELDELLKINRDKLIKLEKKQSEISEKDQTGLLENFRTKIIELEKTLNPIITLPSKPENNFSVLSEVEEWKSWLKGVLNTVTEKRGIINRLISQRQENNINTSYKKQENEFIKSVEELERELKQVSQQEEDRKKKVDQLENNLKIIDEEIKFITTLFGKIDIKRNNKEEINKTIEKLELKILNHPEIFREIETKKTEMNKILEKSKGIKEKLNKLNGHRRDIEKSYSEFIENNENIKRHKIKIDETKKWLNENSDENNKELRNILESELAGFDDRFNNIYEEQKKIEESFDVLATDISNEHCPLCGVDHPSEQQLMASIKKQKGRTIHRLFELNSKFTSLKNKMREMKQLTVLREEKEKKLRESENAVKGIEAENESLKDFLKPMLDFYKIEEVEVLSEKLFLNLLRFNESIEVELKSAYGDMEKKYEKIKDKNDAQIELINSEKELYDTRVKESNYLTKQIEKMESDILNEIVHYGYKEKLTESNVINFSNEVKVNFKSQLQQELESNKFLIESKKIKNELYYNYVQQQDVLLSALTSFKELEVFLGSIEESIELLGIKDDLSQKITSVKREIETLTENKKCQREIQRKETNKEIGKMATRISTIFEILTDTSPWKTIMSDAVVPGLRERTNLIFRPIPHKFKNDLESYIENTNSNSTFAFSGGQLSLLGLSIFLSQVADEYSIANKNKEILDTIILDDPIQMLDTLRDDALISLICDIAQEKQVIISTSDINFANKLILASRPLWEFDKDSCGILHFDRLEEEGPIISEYLPEKWITDQRIYYPKIKAAR